MPATYALHQIRNLALLGASGGGKTTLAEALLHAAASLPTPGRVEDGSTQSDFTDEEKTHGRSLFAALLHIDHQGHHVNLLDTPGLPDFMGQTISVLPAIETAVLVIHAGRGVEAQTRRLLRHVVERRLCRMIVVNHIDSVAPAELASLLTSIQQTLGAECLPLNLPADGGRRVIDCLSQHEGDSDLGPVADHHTALIERIVEVDEAAMDQYLEQGDVLTPEQLHEPFEKALREGHLMPICFTAARPADADTAAVGVKELLDVIVRHLPNPAEGNPRPFVRGEGKQLDLEHELHAVADPSLHALGHVFNVRVDPFVGKLAAVRVHQGTLKVGQSVFVDDPREGELRKPVRLAHLLQVQGKKTQEVQEAIAGDIVAISKVDALHWDAVLHDSHEEDNLHLRPLRMPEPMAGLAITARKRGDEQKIADALVKLQEEDPTFRVRRDETTHETVIHGLGELHLRVVLEKLAHQHHVEVDTALPSIAYRETIVGKADGHYRHKKQTGGAGQFGEVYLRVEALPRGAGFEFVDDTFGGSVPRQYLPAIEKGVRQAMGQGPVAGYPLQDVRVSVYDGKYHAVDSKEIAFLTAGRGAFVDAIAKAGPTLLEPVAQLEVTVPASHMGEVTADLSGKRGRVLSTDLAGEDRVLIVALVPLAELTLYANQLKAMTGGQGSYSLEGAGHEPLPPHLHSKVTPREHAPY